MPSAKVTPSTILTFPSFLLPSIPFYRRKSSQTPHPVSVGNANYHNPKLNGVGERERYLQGHVSYLQCACCAADICLTSQIISKGFTGRHGRAYLVSASSGSLTGLTSTTSLTSSLPNTIMQKAVPRQLVTGAHTVCDVSCIFCGSILGWKYVAAEEESQRYKVGKFILETKRISTSSCWENGFDETSGHLSSKQPDAARLNTLENSVEFDSQDEDECEDLFAGVWNVGLAVRRRSRKFENLRGSS
ncbi:hypothetical protein Egran_03827 [Elaphomyces granulatus]|uniref:Yippee domain-containing protein n=1 Tax=Elaphomyces granulatus TaxID=519963 RepID=A0A232LW56_9EURO|nr:hypothetical protein Egran_03827 [Elaphomyces granulatus]